MDILAERLDQKLREWSPETAEQVRGQVVEIIELADQGLLDIVRSRQVEQEVLDLLDEPTSRVSLDGGSRLRAEVSTGRDRLPSGPGPAAGFDRLCPLTTQDRASPYEVRLPRIRFLEKGSVANVQGIASLPTVRLGR